MPASLAGLPAMSVPCGFGRGRPAGRPAAHRQLFRRGEDRLLAVAAPFQRATDWHPARAAGRRRRAHGSPGVARSRGDAASRASHGLRRSRRRRLFDAARHRSARQRAHACRDESPTAGDHLQRAIGTQADDDGFRETGPARGARQRRAVVVDGRYGSGKRGRCRFEQATSSRPSDARTSRWSRATAAVASCWSTRSRAA